jgi:REP element-mobilizing transposase RayT
MQKPHNHNGWHSRGYLPHLDTPDIIQSITFRLNDSLPKKVIDRWKQELENVASKDKSESEKILHNRIAKFEDAGHGSCLLHNPTCADIVQNALLHFDANRYRLLEWCIMPNHVHVLIHCPAGTQIGEIVKSWKTHSAREINRVLLRQGSLWSHDYHDRYIRDSVHLVNVRSYIRNNPVNAGLCLSPEEWPWSSVSQTGTASL